MAQACDPNDWGVEGQEDRESKVIFYYIESPKSAWGTWDPDEQQANKQEKISPFTLTASWLFKTLVNISLTQSLKCVLGGKVVSVLLLWTCGWVLSGFWALPLLTQPRLLRYVC